MSAVGLRRIPHLKRFWLRHTTAGNQGGADWAEDNTLLGGLHLGLRETYEYLYANRPDFEQFEAWILEKNGGALDAATLERLQTALNDGPEMGARATAAEPALSSEDLAFWDEHGYVILHDAVTPAQCEAAAQAIYSFLEMDPGKPDTWYKGQQGHSIWVPLLHHPALWENRESPRIRRAFAQLWGRDDLWPSVDQAGMNPPERPGWRFPGPNLHWDVSLESPIPFGVQGILYLTDTAANQGAFTCVPGFHRKVESWLRDLPTGADPRTQDLAALGPVPIAGRAGDLVIWHHALPHGSSPNRTDRPRVVQYIRMAPTRWEYNARWR